MKFKILFQKVFYPTLKRYYVIILSWSIEIKKVFLFYIEKTQFFSCEHRVDILKSFKSHIEKIKHSSSIYIVNFEKC